jgi:hypothetical protein
MYLSEIEKSERYNIRERWRERMQEMDESRNPY